MRARDLEKRKGDAIPMRVAGKRKTKKRERPNGKRDWNGEK